MRAFTVKHSDLTRCPRMSMSPMHYRTDGTCGCVGPTLDEAAEHIDRGVVYVPYEGAAPEQGVITSANQTYVFVRYDGDQQSKATRPEDLRWMTP